MTTDEPAPSDTSSWLTIGARAVDTGTGRTGVVLLLRDAAGNVHTEEIERPVRALLRCEGRREPRWWAEVGELRSAP